MSRQSNRNPICNISLRTVLIIVAVLVAVIFISPIYGNLRSIGQQDKMKSYLDQRYGGKEFTVYNVRYVTSNEIGGRSYVGGEAYPNDMPTVKFSVSEYDRNPPYRYSDSLLLTLGFKKDAKFDSTFNSVIKPINSNLDYTLSLVQLPSDMTTGYMGLKGVKQHLKVELRKTLNPEDWAHYRDILTEVAARLNQTDYKSLGFTFYVPPKGGLSTKEGFDCSVSAEIIGSTDSVASNFNRCAWGNASMSEYLSSHGILL